MDEKSPQSNEQPFTPEEFEKILLKADADALSATIINDISVLRKALKEKAVFQPQKDDATKFLVPVQDSEWVGEQLKLLKEYEQAFDQLLDSATGAWFMNLKNFKDKAAFRLRTDRVNPEGKSSWSFSRKKLGQKPSNSLEIINNLDGKEPSVFNDWGYCIMRAKPFSTLFLSARPVTPFWRALVLSFGLTELMADKQLSGDRMTAEMAFYLRKLTVISTADQIAEHIVKDPEKLARARYVCGVILNDELFGEMLSGNDRELHGRTMDSFIGALGIPDCANKTEENFRSRFLELLAVEARLHFSFKEQDRFNGQLGERGANAIEVMKSIPAFRNHEKLVLEPISPRNRI